MSGWRLAQRRAIFEASWYARECVLWAIGLAIGLIASFALNRVLKSQLVQVSPADPGHFDGRLRRAGLAAALGCLITGAPRDPRRSTGGSESGVMQRPIPKDAFETVRAVGLTLPNVEATTKYDGSPVLKLGGSFMAGLATHPSAEPDTLVVRVDDEQREWLIEDAPETYYLTDYYRKYPLVLVRLSRIDRDALRDVLSVSWRLTAAKVRRRALQKFNALE